MSERCQEAAVFRQLAIKVSASPALTRRSPTTLTRHDHDVLAFNAFIRELNVRLPSAC